MRLKTQRRQSKRRTMKVILTSIRVSLRIARLPRSIKISPTLSPEQERTWTSPMKLTLLLTKKPERDLGSTEELRA